MKTTKPCYMGSSRDGRTNKWKITCPACGYVFEPSTTRFAVQYLDCNKCGCSMKADYNAEVVTQDSEVRK